MSWKVYLLVLASWHCVTGSWIDSQCSGRSNRFQIGFQLCHFACYDVSVMFKDCLDWRYPPKKCRWHVSDNFQFPLKGATIYKTSRHSLHFSDGLAVISRQRSASFTLWTSLCSWLCTANCSFFSLIITLLFLASLYKQTVSTTE